MPKACFAKEIQLDLIETSKYKKGLKQHYKIEREFGEAKQGHGLGRCRYLGLTGFGVHAYFTAIASNLKWMIKALTEVGLENKKPFDCLNQGGFVSTA